jgi:hypothetical protein
MKSKQSVLLLSRQRSKWNEIIIYIAQKRNIHIISFLDIVLCSLTEVDPYFRLPWWWRQYTCTSENVGQLKQDYTVLYPWRLYLHTCCCESLKSHKNIQFDISTAGRPVNHLRSNKAYTIQPNKQGDSCGNDSYLYSGDTWFKSWPWHRLSCWIHVWIFLSHSRYMSR